MMLSKIKTFQLKKCRTIFKNIFILEENGRIFFVYIKISHVITGLLSNNSVKKGVEVVIHHIYSEFSD